MKFAVAALLGLVSTKVTINIDDEQMKKQAQQSMRNTQKFVGEHEKQFRQIGKDGAKMINQQQAAEVARSRDILLGSIDSIRMQLDAFILPGSKCDADALEVCLATQPPRPYPPVGIATMPYGIFKKCVQNTTCDAEWSQMSKADHSAWMEKFQTSNGKVVSKLGELQEVYARSFNDFFANNQKNGEEIYDGFMQLENQNMLIAGCKPECADACTNNGPREYMQCAERSLGMDFYWIEEICGCNKLIDVKFSRRVEQEMKDFDQEMNQTIDNCMDDVPLPDEQNMTMNETAGEDWAIGDAPAGLGVWGDTVMVEMQPATNGWHYVTIDNPLGDSYNYVWSNRAGVVWDLYADIVPETGMLAGFTVGANCPYYNNGHTYAAAMYTPDGTFDYILGPWDEKYQFVTKF